MSIRRRFLPPPTLSSSAYACVCVNISYIICRAGSRPLIVRSRVLSLDLTRSPSLSLSQSLPPFLTVPFSPSTVSSSGEEYAPPPPRP